MTFFAILNPGLIIFPLKSRDKKIKCLMFNSLITTDDGICEDCYDCVPTQCTWEKSIVNSLIVIA